MVYFLHFFYFRKGSLKKTGIDFIKVQQKCNGFLDTRRTRSGATLLLFLGNAATLQIVTSRFAIDGHGFAFGACTV